MLFIPQWRAPKGHDRIANIFVDGTAILLNGDRHVGQVGVHQRG